MNCRYSKTYSGRRKPKCNGGESCELCNTKYGLQELARILDRPPFELKGKDYKYVSRFLFLLNISTFNCERRIKEENLK
jgi:hypothetical protein